MTHLIAVAMSYAVPQSQLKLLHSFYIALPNVSFNQKPHSLIPQKEPAELRVNYFYSNQIFDGRPQFANCNLKDCPLYGSRVSPGRHSNLGLPSSSRGN
jgi:hypothetical protein